MRTKNPLPLSLLNGKDLRIGVVQARFNEPLTAQLTQSCKAELLALGVAEKRIKVVTVPGALEIAVVLDAMAASERYDALVAIGCIIRGETYHFEVVANESAAGLTRVSLDHHIGIANAILTVDNVAQASVRAEEKGRGSARVAVEMANLRDELL